MIGAMTCKLDALALKLTLQQGATLRFRITVRRSSTDGGGPFNLTGWTPRGQVRANRDETGTPLASLSFTVLSAPEGRLEARIGADVTETIVEPVMCFDVELVNDMDATDVWRIGQGMLYLDTESTK
jgi:hypothetical protein